MGRLISLGVLCLLLAGCDNSCDYHKIHVGDTVAQLKAACGEPWSISANTDTERTQWSYMGNFTFVWVENHKIESFDYNAAYNEQD